MVQPGDTIVWNGSAWVNASGSSDGTIAPTALAIGAAGGSQVSLQPDIGDTVQLGLAGPIATITAALQLSTGDPDEVSPAWFCAYVINGGAVNATIGTLTITGQCRTSGGEIAMCIMQQGSAANGSTNGTIQLGRISLNSPTSTYYFDAYQQIFPDSNQVTFKKGTGLFAASNQVGGSGAEGWNNMSGFSAGFSAGSPAIPQYRMLPLHGGAVAFRGTINLPSAGSYNLTTFYTLPSAYQPNEPCRWAATNVTSGATAIVIVGTDGTMRFEGIGASANSNVMQIDGIAWVG